MRSYVGVHLSGHQHGGRKPTKISVTEFSVESVNSNLEELINTKVLYILIFNQG